MVLPFQELLRCSVHLEKLHKLNQSRLQRTLLVRHEEASAKVQRQIVEHRRVELHKIFSEELEEAVRMDELEKSAAKSLLHKYFTCQVRRTRILCRRTGASHFGGAAGSRLERQGANNVLSSSGFAF